MQRMPRKLLPLACFFLISTVQPSASMARRLAPRNAWNRLCMGSGSVRAWDRLRSISYRYLVHAYDPSGRLLWQRSESHIVRRLPSGLEQRIQYRDAHGEKWIIVRGRDRQWVSCNDAPRDWLDLPAPLRLRLTMDLFVLEHPYLLHRKGTESRYVGLGRVRGRDCASFEVVYPRSDAPPAPRARIDCLHPEGWLHRIRMLPVDGNASTWNVHLSQQLPCGPFRIPLRREYQVDGTLWRKTVLTDVVLDKKLADDLFLQPAHPLR